MFHILERICLYCYLNPEFLRFLCVCFPTGGIGCEGGQCNCGFQDGRERVDGGLLTDQDTLPATGLKLPASSGARRVTISALKCYGEINWKESMYCHFAIGHVLAIMCTHP